MTEKNTEENNAGKSGVGKTGKVDWPIVLSIGFFVLTTLVMVGAMVFGVGLVGVEGKEGVADILSAFAASPWAPFVVIALFTLLGFTGFPQFLLIGGTVAIFGGVFGFAYSWVATMVSALVGFLIGRASGRRVLERFGGERVQRLSGLLERRGAIASAIVRVVPSGPFVMINLVAGVAPIALWRFALGTGLGILPKTAIIAFAGDQFIEFLKHRDPVEFVLAGLALTLWILSGIWLKGRFLPTRNAEEATTEANSEVASKLSDGSVH